MATVNYTTTDKFKKKLAKLAADHNIEFSTEDDARLLQRLAEAYNEICGELLIRGLDLVGISTWARGEEFQLDIATYWYGRDSKWGRKNFEDVDWIKVFDRRAELKVIPLVNNDGELMAGSNEAVAVGFDLQKINEDLNLT